MQKSRRIGAYVALATTAAGIAAVTAAAPASAVVRGPQPVSSWLQKVPANASSWVNIHWRTDRRICDVEVRVRGERGMKVDHLGFRRSGTLSRGDSLRAGRTDYTRVRVTPIQRNSGVAKLWATISYDECGFKARTQTRTAVLSLPVLRKTSPGGHGGPGGPGHGHPGGPGQGPGGGHGGPGQGGPGHHNPGGGQGQPGKPGGQHGQPGKPGGQHGQPGKPGHGNWPGRPSTQPTTAPTAQPTSQPTSQPTAQPTAQPTGQPTAQPTGQPTVRPTWTRQPGGPNGGGPNGGGGNNNGGNNNGGGNQDWPRR